MSQSPKTVRIEKDAGVAQNLINKHRKEGYIFALFRKNASIAYLTLDVLEMQCPVISRKHWSSCEHRPFLSGRSSADFVHHVPIVSEHDVLQAPDANFLDHPLPDQGRHGSKSCPGKPKFSPLLILIVSVSQCGPRSDLVYVSPPALSILCVYPV
ncbi:histidine-rich glycoprotein-like [Pseudonaja textilis]|uniref:histidine-rich glycoprotein-like n=1 Tax=Pseudonaja textilis TaxID=8673 RepID=UPI000EA93F65|nr:histidine-rich glycoprotein-like [Pseudonaja textilis]